jgi:hypothetical protein
VNIHLHHNKRTAPQRDTLVLFSYFGRRLTNDQYVCVDAEYDSLVMGSQDYANCDGADVSAATLPVNRHPPILTQPPSSVPAPLLDLALT